MIGFDMMTAIQRNSNKSFFLAISATLILGACNKDGKVSDEQHLERAKAFQSQGNVQSEVIELKNLLQEKPNHPEGNLLLGEAYAELGYGKDAEKTLLRAQEFGISREKFIVPLGKSLLDQKEYKRVLSEIKPVIATPPKDVAAITALHAQAELGLKQFEKGCESFRNAKQADPTYVPAYWGIAQCSLGFGKPIEAEEELDAALKVDPKNAGTWLVRGDLWRGKQQNAEAEKAYSSGLSLRPNHIDLLLARASVRVPLGNHPGALEDIAKADQQVKDHPLALHLRGVMLSKEKKYAEAKTAFETVLKTNPQYLPTILWLGITDYALNNLEQAKIGRAHV